MQQKHAEIASPPDISSAVRQPVAAIAEVVLLSVTLTVIAFQTPRRENYETEKVGLLGLLAAVLLGGFVITLLRDRRFFHDLRAGKRGAIRTPLYAAVLVWLGVNLVSSIFSLSPAFSFLGEPSRAQGSLTLCLYIILFLQAASLSQSLRTALVPFLLLASVPLCLWSILLYTQQMNRLELGGPTGNPNFLSSWLVMVVLYCVPQLWGRVSRWPQPWSRRQRLSVIFYGLLLLLMLVTLLLNASRGALLGFGVGLVYVLLIVAALTRSRRLLVGLGGLVLAGILVYGGAGLLIRRQTGGGTAGSAPISRLFTPYDSTRLAIWQGAAVVVAGQSDPMLTMNRQPDRLAILRPLIGYGPDTAEQIQSRVGDIFTSGSIINSFHNQIFDTVIGEGWIGLAAWIGLLGAGLYSGQRTLGLVIKRNVGRWIAWLAVGAASGGVFFALMIAPGSPAAVLPLGAGLGAALGLLLWTARQVFTSTKERVSISLATLLSDERGVLVLAVSGIVVAQWVDNQFGFATASTQPLWWIVVGLLAGSSRYGQRTASATNAEAGQRAGESVAWLTATLGAGLFVLHSFGEATRGQSFQLGTGTAAEPFILLAVLLVGCCGLFLPVSSADTQSGKTWLLWGAAVVIIWALFFIVKLALITPAGAAFDRVFSLSDPAHVVDDLATAARLLSMSGIVVILSVTIGGFWLWSLAQEPQAPLTRRLLLVIVATPLILVSGLFYSNAYTGDVLHNIGTTLANHPDSPATAEELKIASAALGAAYTYTPANVYERLHHAIILLGQYNLERDTTKRSAIRGQIGQLIASIFQQQPYFVNTMEWRNFSEEYQKLGFAQ